MRPNAIAPGHGRARLPAVTVESYSLSIPDEERSGQWGDRASRSAFIDILGAWRRLYKRMQGTDPFDGMPPHKVRREVDNLLQGNEAQAQTVAAAIEDYACQLALVVRRLLQEPTWLGVQRIIIGGGFEDSEAGKVAVARADHLLQRLDANVELRLLHHHPDEGGLVGWVHIVPREQLRQMRAFLAVDIGGTNVRCGIVAYDDDDAADLTRVRVIKREKWRHAEGEPRQGDLVEGIVAMLRRAIDHAAHHHIALAPFVGIACPGLIRADGSIERGADNLPGDWHAASFHLPRRLAENLPRIGDAATVVAMHNDAVVQGLSERPFVQDVQRWAVLTIGTGLGNASYCNTDGRPGGS